MCPHPTLPLGGMEPVFVESMTEAANLTDLLELFRRPEWHRRAACRGRTDLTWFPQRGESSDEAKAVCATCPVIDECGDAGQRERFGVWGGLSDRGRRQARREQRAA